MDKGMQAIFDADAKRAARQETEEERKARFEREIKAGLYWYYRRQYKHNNAEDCAKDLIGLFRRVPGVTPDDAPILARKLLNSRVGRHGNIYCADWDDQNNLAHPMVCLETGRVRGVLQPVDYEMVARSPGIQTWSKRDGEEGAQNA